MTHYQAFISYSHAKDKPIARELQHVIQTLGKRWYQRRSVRVFRDDTSLTASPALWPTIAAALEQSEFLILLASPEAATSHWVNQEVEWWLSHKSADTLLIGLTAGSLVWEPTSRRFRADDDYPLPPSATDRFQAEPLWTDLRPWRTSTLDARHDAAFKSLASKFAGRVRNQSPEDLWSEELRQQKLNLRLAYTAVGSLTILTILAVAAGLFAQRQQALAQFNYLRQAEITASQYLRQGEFGKAVHSLQNVVAAADARLTSHTRYSTLLARFEPLRAVLNRHAVWSPLTWQDHAYVRGAADLELHSLGTMVEPHWLRFHDSIIVLSPRGDIAVFNQRSKLVVAKSVAQDIIKPCDVEVDGDHSVRIYGIGASGVTLGGVFYGRWSVSPQGQLAYDTDHYNTGSWRNAGICPDLKQSARYAELVKPVSAVVFPSMLDEGVLWTTGQRDMVSRQHVVTFFEGLQPDKIESLFEPGGNRATPQEAADGLYCKDSYCEQGLELRELIGARVLFGLRTWGMAGETYRFCARVTQDARVACTQFEFSYGNQRLNGLRFSPRHDLAVVYGRAFKARRHWAEDGQVASLAIAQGPDFATWEVMPIAELDADILDARVSPDGHHIAILSGWGILVADIAKGSGIVRRFNAIDVREIAWTGNSGLAFLTGDGAIRSRDLNGSETWSDLHLSGLPFESKENTPRKWWLETSIASDLLLVGNGQTAIIVDAKLGAPITGSFALVSNNTQFSRPALESLPTGEIRITTRRSELRRATTVITDVPGLVGRPGLLTLSDLVPGSTN